MSSLQELQEWYLSQCNEDWEHSYGVSIGTIDNPGWSLEVDLSDTNMEYVSYKEYSYGVGEDGDSSGDNWLFTKVENSKFIAYGGARKLEEMINTFLEWVKYQQE